MHLAKHDGLVPTSLVSKATQIFWVPQSHGWRGPQSSDGVSQWWEGWSGSMPTRSPSGFSAICKSKGKVTGQGRKGELDRSSGHYMERTSCVKDDYASSSEVLMGALERGRQNGLPDTEGPRALSQQSIEVKESQGERSSERDPRSLSLPVCQTKQARSWTPQCPSAGATGSRDDMAEH